MLRCATDSKGARMVLLALRGMKYPRMVRQGQTHRVCAVKSTHSICYD